MTQHVGAALAGASRLQPGTSLREQVEESLASQIIAGMLEPGTVLTAPTLAAQYGVSATPVREALLTLQRRGFLEPLRNKGFRVTDVSLHELRQLAEVRQLLECPPMRELAGHLPESARAELQSLADEIVASGQEGRLQDYLSADTRFHLLLIDLVGNDHLTRIVRDLRQQTRLGGLAALSESRLLAESAAEHHELLALLVRGDGEAAEALMRRHIGHVPGIWSGNLEHGAG
ncbi:GntR family transcriptional regulator [Agrococcus sp. SCSIO52902]|uniref:GntR family transcriptional regulator n=1 Tax=Agrococcus sp. SCSIO52902 TaxID=2933290 RepID=UPI001FF4A1AD|nr:GntR family transcriptional regulator [Agrococcus sp. SCSIO52902]UOW01947.1 GntR family transcriptional regulator [Agrococcus sp. SCSIO52902]